MQPFPAWRPDAFSLGTGFASDIEGVLPAAGGWGPWPALEPISAAVAAAVRGAFIARKSDNTLVIFAATATKIYKYATASSWTEVTRGIGTVVDNYALGTDNSWMFDQFGDYVIAVNGVDEPQVYTLASSTEFADLAGSPPVGAAGVKVVGDHIWLYNFTTAIGPSGIVPSGKVQIQWSGFRDHDYWTLGEKSSDFATFPSGGYVMGCTTQLAGLVFLERAIWRYVKDPVKVFDFAPVQEEQGTPSPYSIVQHEGDAYFYGTDGFCGIGVASGVKQIGTDWVNEWFLGHVNQSRLKTIIGALDPTRMRAYWIAPDPSNTSSYTRNFIICYDMLNQDLPWTKATVESEFIFSAAVPGATLDDLTTLYSTLDGVPFPIGSDAWLGGAPRLGAFNSAHKYATFSGNGIAASVETSDFQPIPGRRFYVNGFRLVSDVSTAKGYVSVKERPQDTATPKASASLTAQGLIPARASGKILKVTATVPAGEEWDFLVGVDFMDGDLRPDGVR